MQAFRENNTYHKFVKTTPNPSATKNSSGELVGPLLLLPLLESPVGLGMGDEVVVCDIVIQRNGYRCLARQRTLNEEVHAGGHWQS